MLKKGSVALIVFAGILAMAFNPIGEDILTNDGKTELTKEGAYEPIVVLELFTSQGCSSCPAADLLLEKAKKQFEKEVFALSYHVDYWNYIGWEDPFSQSRYSKKQRQYNIKFRNRSNYTPQLVVNGREHFVGSSNTKVSQAISKYKQAKAENHLKANEVRVDGDKVTFSYAIAGPRATKNLRALLVLDKRTTSVKRGENRNRTLTNSNVVVAEKILTLDAASGSVALNIPQIVRPHEKISLIVLIENDNYDITAATKRPLERT